MTTANPTQPTSRDAHGRPTASIVIPVHNKATITRQCVDALLAESDDQIRRQLVIVDDGSTDWTPSLLATYGDRFSSFATRPRSVSPQPATLESRQRLASL